MPYEVKLSQVPAGFAAESKERGSNKVTIYSKGLFTAQSGSFYYKMLDGFASAYLGPYLSTGPKLISSVNDVVVIVQQDRKATVYVNEVGYQSRVQVKKATKRGEGVAREDIADIDDFKIVHPNRGELLIPDDVGFYCFMRVGWRQAFYFDVEPLVGKNREVPVGRTLARCWALLSFDEVFSLNNEEFEKLFDVGWFPFIAILGAPFEELSNAIKSGFDPNTAIQKIMRKFDDSALGEMLQRFEGYDFLKEHVPFLKAGIERYKAGDYISCVSNVWPRIEGAMWQLVGSADKRPKQKELVEVLEEHVVSRKPFSQLYLPERFSEYLLKAYFSEFELADVAYDVSRHTLAHGLASADDCQKEKALIGLLMFDQIAYYLSLKKEKSEEVDERGQET